MLRAAPVVVLMGLSWLGCAQNACDDAHGLHCPEESGWEVGDCLMKLDEGDVGEKCQSFMTLQNACRSDIDAHCGGKEYTGDLLPCLTEWTSPDVISAECKALFPEKPSPVTKRKKTKKEKDRDKKRKSIRNKAANLMRKQQGDL